MKNPMTRTLVVRLPDCPAFDGLVHPIHQKGAVFAWEVLPD